MKVYLATKFTLPKAEREARLELMTFDFQERFGSVAQLCTVQARATLGTTLISDHRTEEEDSGRV